MCTGRCGLISPSSFSVCGANVLSFSLVISQRTSWRWQRNATLAARATSAKNRRAKWTGNSDTPRWTAVRHQTKATANSPARPSAVMIFTGPAGWAPWEANARPTTVVVKQAARARPK